MRPWFRTAILVLTFCLGGGARASAREPHEWPTNLDLLRAALVEAVGQLVAGLPDSAKRVAVTVPPDLAVMRSQLVRSAVVQALLQRGVVVELERPGTMAIEVSVRRMDVTITKTLRPWFVGRRWAHREAYVSLTAVFDASRGLTVGAADGEGRASDAVPVSALAWCTGPAELGLAPELPESSWTRLAEPMVVMASVAAVIYLFFTQ